MAWSSHSQKRVSYCPWTSPCPHLKRKICLPLLKTLLLIWQKRWKLNLWSPESSVKELKQSQEGKRLQQLWAHTSLCSPISCPPRDQPFLVPGHLPLWLSSPPSESRGPHAWVLGGVPLTARRTKRMARGCCCDAPFGGGKSAQVWKMQCVCRWDCSDCVRLRGEGEKKKQKTRIAIRGCPGRKKNHNL